MKKLYTLLFVAFALSMNAQIITQWNFDDVVPANAMLPTTGSGTFTLIGGVVDNLTSGLMPGGNPSTGKAYSIKNFPAAATASGTAGYEFALPTGGFPDPINVTFDSRGSNSSSRWQQYEVSIDGTNWIVIGDNGGVLTNAFTATPMVRLNLPAGSGNNDAFKFRIVSIFDPVSGDYSPVGYQATPPSNYNAASGAWRIDNATFSTGLLAVVENNIAGLNVYPNPVTNGVLYINTQANAEKNVVIFDVLGKQVFNTTTAATDINIASLKAGVYIVNITENGKTAVSKLMVK